MMLHIKHVELIVIALTSKYNLYYNTMLKLEAKLIQSLFSILFNPYFTKATVIVWLITLWVHA